MITGGGILILIVIGIIIGGVILINAWRKGATINFKSIKDIRNIKDNIKNRNVDDGTVLCLNIYEDKIKAEFMLKTSVNLKADTWELGSKKYLYQGVVGKEYIRLDLPTKVSWPTERLARMMGCLPLRKLKSLKFGLLEKLAPFAPVAAIGIGALLFIIVL